MITEGQRDYMREFGFLLDRRDSLTRALAEVEAKITAEANNRLAQVVIEVRERMKTKTY